MGVSSETQDRIIDSAIRVFAEKGYHGSTTSEIAKDAGVAEGTIFKYYSTKKKLLSTVLDKIVHEIIPRIADIPVEDILRECTDGDAKKMIKEVITKKLMQINGKISAFRILISELQYHSDLKDEYINKFVPSMLAKLEDVFKFGIKSGVFRDINPHTAARSFMGMLALTILERNVLEKDMDFSLEVDRIMDIYYNGVGKKVKI